MKLSRRSFLKSSTAASAGIALTGGLVKSVIGATAAATAAAPVNKWPGRVVINFNRNAATLSSSGASTINTAVIKTMIDDSVIRLTGASTLAEAWKAVFPATLSATSKIAIKVPLGYATPTMGQPWQLVRAITDGLQLMDFGGTKFPAANITIYNMNFNYALSTYGITTANFPGGIRVVADSRGTFTDGANGLAYAASLNSANFLINVFRPGGHDSPYGGFTLGFKNHFGTYAPSHNGSPADQAYLRDINCLGAVYNKSVLSICAGIFGAAELGGPNSAVISYYNYARTMDSTITTQPVPSTTVIMSTDPVSAEVQAIKMMRVNSGGGYATSNMPQYLRASGGVTGALSDATYNIGVISEANMEIRRIINGVPSVAIRKNELSAGSPGAGIAVSQINQHSTFIEYSLPENHLNQSVTIEIFNLKGTRIFMITQKAHGLLNHVSWNETDSSGNHVGKGIYIASMLAGDITVSTKFTIAR